MSFRDINDLEYWAVSFKVHRMRAIATMVTLVAVLSPIRADNQPAAASPVQHLLIFKNIGEFPEYLFYVCPDELQQAKSAIRVPETGEVTVSEIDSIAAKRGIYLFAVPKELLAKADDPPKLEWFSGQFAGVLKSQPLVFRLPVSVFNIDIATELVVTEVEGTSAQFSTPQVEVERAIALGLISSVSRWVWIVGGAILGVAAVLVCYLALQRLSHRR